MTCLIVQQTVQKAVSERTGNNYWKGSVFEELVTLDNDTRGKWGEEVLFEFVKNYTSLDISWDRDNNLNTDDGVYDMYITAKKPTKKVRMEVKTAFRGKANCWQHEGIYALEAWDKLVLLDLDYSELLITVLDYSEMVFDGKHPIFGRKPHLRKDVSDKYKWDFGLKQLELGLENGLTYCHKVLEPDYTQLAAFLVEKLS